MSHRLRSHRRRRWVFRLWDTAGWDSNPRDACTPNGFQDTEIWLSCWLNAARTPARSPPARARAPARYITYEAIERLLAGRHAETSWLGIGLGIGFVSSVIRMPLLGSRSAGLPTS